MASRGSTSSANGLLPSGSSNNNININNNHHIHDDHDEEAGPGSVKSYSDDEISSYDPFDIPQTKNASLETLKRWRVIQITMALCFNIFIFSLLFIYCFNEISRDFFFFF
jgi:hypothetical protein